MSPPIYYLIPNAPKPVAPYSHVVEADGWLFVTGQLATDPDDDSLPLPEGIEAQTRKVMDNLKRALTGAGAGFQDVVCVRIFLTNFERDYAAFNRLYTEYFRPDVLAEAIAEAKREARAQGLTDEEIGAELDEWRAERPA